MREWGAGLMSVLPSALSYVVSQARDVDSNTNAWSVILQHTTFIFTIAMVNVT